MYQEREIFHLYELQPLLEKAGLKRNGDTDFTLGLYDGSRLVATGSIRDSIVQMVAVDPDYQGEGLAAKVVSALLSRASYEGWLPLYLFTKPENAQTFSALGFRLVTAAPPYAALLEYGSPNIRDFCRRLQTFRRPGSGSALVMNCNPFTLGHRYLVEQAAAQSENLYLFVVEEDRSVFPFRDRLELVRQGTADLSNVVVIPGGRYIISGLTFPSYFTKEENLARAHATLDAAIFRDHIAPALDIRRRFVGTEPFSPTTAVYNRVLEESFRGSNLSLTELPRIEKDGTAISASRVRSLLKEGRTQEAEALVPNTTARYLRSPAGQAVIAQLKSEK